MQEEFRFGLRVIDSSMLITLVKAGRAKPLWYLHPLPSWFLQVSSPVDVKVDGTCLCFAEPWLDGRGRSQKEGEPQDAPEGFECVVAGSAVSR
jgi:hypothetical protein